jgi:hypothetical protein
MWYAAISFVSESRAVHVQTEPTPKPCSSGRTFLSFAPTNDQISSHCTRRQRRLDVGVVVLAAGRAEIGEEHACHLAPCWIVMRCTSTAPSGMAQLFECPSVDHQTRSAMISGHTNAFRHVAGSMRNSLLLRSLLRDSVNPLQSQALEGARTSGFGRLLHGSEGPRSSLRR